jgi:hypothetical protein
MLHFVQNDRQAMTAGRYCRCLGQAYPTALTLRKGCKLGEERCARLFRQGETTNA